jgi:hypothetical protein
MKSINSFVLASFLITSSFSFAQDNKFDIGIEGGPSLISLRGNVAINNQTTTAGFLGGVFCQYNFSKVFSLRTGLAYEQKGTSSPSFVNDNLGNVLGQVNVRSQFNYLTMPLLVRATFGQKIKYFVNAGPYYGYLINQKLETASTTFKRDFTDNTFFYNRADFGISTGLGISIPIKSRFALSAEIRHNLGLANISKLPVIGAGTINTNATNVLFGVTYKLGKRKDAAI